MSRRWYTVIAERIGEPPDRVRLLHGRGYWLSPTLPAAFEALVEYVADPEVGPRDRAAACVALKNCLGRVRSAYGPWDRRKS